MAFALSLVFALTASLGLIQPDPIKIAFPHFIYLETFSETFSKSALKDSVKLCENSLESSIKRVIFNA